MPTVSLTKARIHLSRLIHKVECGEDIVITRNGRPVARITAVNQPKKPIDFHGLAKLLETLPPWSKPSAELLREMRDDERY